MLLAIDNGPSPMVREKNAGLYSRRGLDAIRRALLPGGRVAFWSAQDEPSFARRLAGHGFETESHAVHARPRRVTLSAARR